MATGTAVLDFGNGAAEASVLVSGLSGLSPSSHIEPWIQADATAGNPADAHRILAYTADLIVEYVSASSCRLHAACRAGTAGGQFTIHYATL